MPQVLLLDEPTNHMDLDSVEWLEKYLMEQTAGLALCVELLAGALSGGAVVGQEVKKDAKNWGHLFLCVKPEALVDDFDAKAAAVCKAVKDAGARVPGDRSAAEAAARVKADALPIPTKIWESITRTAEHGLAE